MHVQGEGHGGRGEGGCGRGGRGGGRGRGGRRGHKGKKRPDDHDDTSDEDSGEEGDEDDKVTTNKLFLSWYSSTTLLLSLVFVFSCPTLCCFTTVVQIDQAIIPVYIPAYACAHAHALPD